ncbi:MAG TPA: hypothetical protein VE987_05710, partial [Polyangiaceae bacterium]|nr:hypothetical protein [Polyangiaceae bacterium]
MTLSRRARRALIIAFAVAAYLALAVFLQSRQGKRPPRDPHAAVLDADYLSVTYKAQTCADEGIASDKCEAIVARDAREAAGRTDDLKGWESCFYDLW